MSGRPSTPDAGCKYAILQFQHHNQVFDRVIPLTDCTSNPRTVNWHRSETNRHMTSDKDGPVAPGKTEHHISLDHARNLLDDVAVQQECQGRSGRPLVWLVEGHAARLAVQTLHWVDQELDGRNDAHRLVLQSTYGVVRLQNHHRTFLHSCILTVAQVGGYWLIRNHEISQDRIPHGDRNPFTYTGVPGVKPTGVFVICALLYGVFAMLQYHINRADYFQQLCLIIGLAAGLLLSSSIPFAVAESSVSIHTLAATTSVAMACSAYGHWTWRTFFSTREIRLEKILAEWGDDAQDMDMNGHVIRFCELP